MSEISDASHASHKHLDNLISLLTTEQQIRDAIKSLDNIIKRAKTIVH